MDIVTVLIKKCVADNGGEKGSGPPNVGWHNLWTALIYKFISENILQWHESGLEEFDQNRKISKTYCNQGSGWWPMGSFRNVFSLTILPGSVSFSHLQPAIESTCGVY